ncbi:MAG: hypothetical protein FHK82_07835 [Sedimenticola thiotaurini]|uniref:Cyclic di-GMP receptor atypical PilZ domain-containing protein n=1 Tax=Sedimenticola thiotaurini TaxID=1543721 RepID=A0A558D3Z7_9GAMM|nr:MAG: hypothetical protein FHK82_07835 [Sedimenticola thiotaurini]
MESASSRGVSFQRRMQISWFVDEEGISSDHVELNDRNTHLLQSLLLAQESHRDIAEEAGDLARVEAKLDLLLDMVSQLLQQREGTTVESDVVLWMGGVCWSVINKPVPSINQALMLVVYIDSSLTQPLRLPVTVTEIRERESCFEVEAEFNHLNEQVIELLEKYVFRQHRRAIAQGKVEKRPV